MFYIKAKVTMRVTGISGPFEYTASYLVNAANKSTAKSKFESQVRVDNKEKETTNFRFEYVEIASTI